MGWFLKIFLNPLYSINGQTVLNTTRFVRE